MTTDLTGPVDELNEQCGRARADIREQFTRARRVAARWEPSPMPEPPQPRPPLPRLYDFATAGRYAGRTEKAMRQLRARGRGPKFRNIDGKLLVTEDDLRAWVQAQIDGAS